MMLLQHSVNSDWLFNTQSRILQADWFLSEINEKVTLKINMSYNYKAYSGSEQLTQSWYLWQGCILVESRHTLALHPLQY